jgi:hypothetical protein
MESDRFSSRWPVSPFDRDKFVESKSFHQKHITLRPQDPEPYYWVGVIDWTLSFRADRELRAAFNQHARGDEQLGEADPTRSLRAFVNSTGRSMAPLSVRGSSL